MDKKQNEKQGVRGGVNRDRTTQRPVDTTQSQPLIEDSFHTRLQMIVNDVSGGNVAAFARMAGISQSGFHRIVGGGDATRKVLIAIADTAGVSLDWLAAGRVENHADIRDVRPYPVDRHLLYSVIRLVEHSLKVNDRRLSLQDKAELIAEIYETTNAKLRPLPIHD